MSGNSVNVVFFGTKEVASLALRDLAKVSCNIIKSIKMKYFSCKSNKSGFKRKPGEVWHRAGFKEKRFQVKTHLTCHALFMLEIVEKPAAGNPPNILLLL